MNGSSTAKKVITRFAPSPTGYLHLGNYRTALFCYLFSKQQAGSFLLRIEDTDKERSKPEYSEDILESLAWMGLSYDEKVVQSDRVQIHRSYLEKLITEDKAYISEEESKQQPGTKVRLVRLRNPGSEITFDDLIRGTITVATHDLGDFVIARSIDDPLYHIAVVIDDFEMGITHIIRGEDHISNTPRHILLQDAIGAPRPIYAHLPMVLAPDRSKLSKRKGALSVKECREAGYLPEAVINTLALVGWNPGTDQELFTLDELVNVFDLSKVSAAGAIFNIEKLNWFNRTYLAALSIDAFIELALPFIPEEIKNLPQYSAERLKKAAPLIRERIDTFREIERLAKEDEVTYYFDAPTYTPEQLSWKGEISLQDIREHLTTAIDALDTIPDDQFGAETVKAAVWDYATEVGRGAVLWPLRFALSGKERSPDPFSLAEVLGKTETLERLVSARNRIDHALNEKS